MSEEKINPEELKQKLEAVIKDFSKILVDLTLIVSNLKPATAKYVAPPPAPIDRMKQVKDSFTKDLQEMLTFEETETYIIIKPRQYLGSENFRETIDMVQFLRGKYVSAGRDSHFEVAK